jgi:hypothetical protein
MRSRTTTGWLRTGLLGVGLLFGCGGPLPPEEETAVRDAALNRPPIVARCKALCDSRFVECDAEADDAFSACECRNARVYCYASCNVWPRAQPMVCTDGY